MVYAKKTIMALSVSLFSLEKAHFKQCKTVYYHLILERWCDVKFPDSQLQSMHVFKRSEESCKIYLARITEAIGPDDIRKHFEQFGQVRSRLLPLK